MTTNEPDHEKTGFLPCKNKNADQLCSNCKVDQRPCFPSMASTILLLPKSNISSFYPSSAAKQTGLCQTRSETSTTGFLTLQLKLLRANFAYFFIKASVVCAH